MTGVEVAVALTWVMFWLFWLASAFSIKRGRIPWSRELLIRVVVAGITLLLAQSGALQGSALNQSVWRDAMGLVALYLGLGFAIWARRTIGENWGAPMSRKDSPDLVTSGPYALVRHPIYAGIVLALIGTAIAISWTWLYAAVLSALYFAYSAWMEERYMTAHFPSDYPSYQQTTRRFIPFVL
jgi:protein-S-isoprenylcysteine O-methyltransferase Ste14